MVVSGHHGCVIHSHSFFSIGCRMQTNALLYWDLQAIAYWFSNSSACLGKNEGKKIEENHTHTHTLLNLPFNHRSLPKGNKPPNNQFLKLRSRIMLIMLTTAVRFFSLKTMLQLVLWKVENVLQQWCSALFKAVCLHRQDASCTYRLSPVCSLWALLLHSVGNEWGCLACCHCNLMASLNGTVAFLCSRIPQAAPSRY